MQVNNRLFEIIYILMQKKKVTAKELADKFEVSTRTIYRDIEILSGANIPIYASKGKDGGIGLLDEYVLNKSILSEEEQNQILFALQGMKKVSGKDEKDILEKLSTLFNKEINDWIKIDFSNWGKDNAQEERFDMIKAAILNKNQIEYTYYSDSHIEGIINVDQNQLIYTSIPYDTSWEIKIDGKTVKPILLLDSLIGIETTPGTHSITMKYKSNYLLPIIISILTFISLIIYTYFNKKKNES